MDVRPERIADEIIGLFKKYGHQQYGEALSQLQHAAQAAALAQRDGQDKEVILAAFLHDIGHFLEYEGHEQMGEFGTEQHDKVGAQYLLDSGFSQRLADLVGSHVIAKRYLTYARTGYYEKLSEASKQTLTYQGGPMDASEAKAFEAAPNFELKIKMREWDDEAKNHEIPAPSIDPYHALITEVLNS